MSRFRRHQRKVPGLNTAALPDLIFTVLFFFMIVTHMRKVTPMVQHVVPAGTELQQLKKKSSIVYIYIGKPKGDTQTRIQLDNRYAEDMEEVERYVAAERSSMSAEDRQQMTVALKVDKDTPMGIVSDVKQALRKVGAYRISYAAVERRRDKM
ncbi:MAG: biopolymer transporter ExbD [Prevotella sp.]|nr:biopolymer transporter ExbD [Prevotella sp.]